MFEKAVSIVLCVEGVVWPESRGAWACKHVKQLRCERTYPIARAAGRSRIAAHRIGRARVRVHHPPPLVTLELDRGVALSTLDLLNTAIRRNQQHAVENIMVLGKSMQLSKLC